MKKNSVIVSVCSNWVNLVLTIIAAFIVSPILVQKLGDESYGIWVLIVSITGYFTVLDFGVNSAIVRFISKYNATKDYKNAQKTYSTSFALFAVVGLVVVFITAIFASFFKDLFSITAFNQQYIYLVFLIVGIDLALKLTFSVLQGTLKGLHKFPEINAISISLMLVKNVLLVCLLYSGYSLLSLALLQALIGGGRYFLQYYVIKNGHSFLTFSLVDINKETLKQLYNYSIYSFLIAIAAKVLFFTDSIVIGSLINVSQVTYYAIPSMIVEYMEKFIYAIVAVLIPLISSREAVGNHQKNSELYIIGTRYAILLISPVIFVLAVAGEDFIGLWMGEEYAKPSGSVLYILLIGYVFLLSQLIANGILKGISKHRILAFILCGEAVVNLGLSVILSPIYGINGVAMGTAIPLVLANVFFIPFYTCRVLNLNYYRYLYRAIIIPVVILLIPLIVIKQFEITVENYIELIVFGIFAVVMFFCTAFLFQLEKTHKNKIVNFLKLKVD